MGTRLELKLGDGGFGKAEAIRLYKGRKVEIGDSQHNVPVPGKDKGTVSMSSYCVGNVDLHYDDMQSMAVLNARPRDVALAEKIYAERAGN